MSASLPASPVLPPTSPSIFSLSEYMPFGKPRRHKLSSSQPNVLSPAKPSPSKHHSDVLVSGGISRTGSPKSTPPHTISRKRASRSIRTAHSSEGSNEQRADSPALTGPRTSEISTVHEPARPRVSFDCARPAATDSTRADTPLSRKSSITGKLRRGDTAGSATHRRATSQPAHNQQDCLVQ